MRDFISTLSKYNINLSKFSSSEVITPLNIVKSMVDLIPTEVFNSKTTFFDPAVKSGRFLIEIYNRLFNSRYMMDEFPNEGFRRDYILNNQLFGIATSSFAATIVRKSLYNDPNKIGNIRCIDGYENIVKTKSLKELVRKAFNQMEFDIVIGNPPYNNDLYLDFVGGGAAALQKVLYYDNPCKMAGKGW